MVMQALAIDLGKYFTWGGKGIADIPEFNTLGGLLSVIVPNIFLIAGLILFVMALFGGFSIISANGSKEKLEQGTKTLTGAIIGFVIIFVSYWIIQLIEYLTAGPGSITNSSF